MQDEIRGELDQELMHAIKRAKVPAGTNDAENEWDTSLSADSIPTNAMASTSPEIEDEVLKSGFTLKLLVAGSIAEKVDELVGRIKLDHFEGNLSDEAELKQYLDESLFAKVLKMIEGPASSGVITSAVLMHHGVTFNTHHRGNDPYGNRDLDHESKEMIKVETCLAYRLGVIASVLSLHGVPWIIVVPHIIGHDPLSVTCLPNMLNN